MPVPCSLKSRKIFATNKIGLLYEIEGYLEMYEKMTGKSIKSKSIDALVDVALSEWQNRNSSYINESKN